MKIKKILTLSLVVNIVFLSNFTTNAFAKEKNSGNLQSSYMSELKANNGNGNANGHNKDNDAGNDDDNDTNPGDNHHIKFHKFAQTIIKFDGDTIDLKTINQGAKSLKEFTRGCTFGIPIEKAPTALLSSSKIGIEVITNRIP